LLVPACQGEVAKVLEFGRPRPDIYCGLEQHSDASDQARLPYYASPEQLRGGPLDWRTDCWSLAVIGYECLSGKRPFEGDSVADLLTRILHEPIPAIPLPESGPWMWVHRWWRKASAREPNERFQSAKELADALGSALRLPRLPVPALVPRAGLPGAEPAILAADPLAVTQLSQRPLHARPLTPPRMPQFLPREPQAEERGTAESCPESPRDDAETAAASDHAGNAVPCPPSPDQDAAAQRDRAPSLARQRVQWIKVAAPLVVLIALGWLVRVEPAEHDAVPASEQVSAPSPSFLDRSAATVPGPQALVTFPRETTTHQANPVRILAVHDSQDGPTASPSQSIPHWTDSASLAPATSSGTGGGGGSISREIPPKAANQGIPSPGSKDAPKPRAPAAAPPARAAPDYGI
jgi:serine/threonine-protein kinase